MSEEDRAGLRVFAPSGVVEDRVMAAVTLARLRNETAGDVLAGVLTDQECFLEALLQIGGVADSFELAGPCGEGPARPW
jgi:hypothetical protein